MMGEFSMRYRKIGDTDMNASEIGMGCEGFSGDGCRVTKKLFDLAEESGVNCFDLYTSNPDVRRAVGKALLGRRQKFLVQSHICSVWENGQYKRTRNIAEVKKGFDEMMRLLGTDYLDVGMIHYCDSLSDWDEIANGGVLDYAEELMKSGRIRHIGLSSHNPKVALKAVMSRAIKVLMFSVNPCYDLQPATEDVEELWNPKNYETPLVNMDPERRELYETCQRMGVGITVMKCFGGGDLLDASLSPAGAALTVHQCIHYALSRPAVAVVLAGARSLAELSHSIAYETAPKEETDYASALAAFPKINWTGHCMYCSHCAPCPKRIDIAYVTKLLNIARAQAKVPETVREHYASLETHAGDCIGCRVCETRCPFGVRVRENMLSAKNTFGY